MAKRIEQMNAGEIANLSKERRESLFKESTIYAVQKSICHCDTGTANKLLKVLPLVTRRSGAKQALVAFFEKWGKLYFDNSSRELRYSKKRNDLTWSAEYEAQVRADRWDNQIGQVQRKKQSGETVNAYEEFKKLLISLHRKSNDPANTILHETLLKRVQSEVYLYGKANNLADEEKSGQTLFDQSVKASTMRASKFAKGVGEAPPGFIDSEQGQGGN